MRWSQVLFLGYIIASTFNAENTQLLFVGFAAVLFGELGVIAVRHIMANKRKGGE